MRRCVIDASVLAKLFFDEPHSDAAEWCLRRYDDLLAPDLVWVETAAVIWKRQRRGDISPEDAGAIVAQVLQLPLNIHGGSGLVPDALDLAVRFDRTVYDCLYLALAIKQRARFVTADQRFVNAVSGTPASSHVMWLGDLG